MCYTVPFSSHSNFNELELFVASIRPGVLKNLNNLARDPLRKAGRIISMAQYSYFLQNMYQRGLDFFNANYVDNTILSKEYLSFANNRQKTKDYLEKLGVREMTDEEQDCKFPRRNITDRRNDPLFVSKVQERKGVVLNGRYNEIKEIELADPTLSESNMRIDYMMQLQELSNLEHEGKNRYSEEINFKNEGAFKNGEDASSPIKILKKFKKN